VKLRRRTESGFWRLMSLLRRRKFLLVGVVIIVVGSTVTLTFLQSPLYEGSAEVILSQQSLAANLSGISEINSSGSPSRYIDTQAQIARTSQVAAATLQEVGVNGRTLDSFLKASSVKTDPNLDILDFKVQDADPALAVRLASAYANQFVKARLELDIAAITGARDRITAEIQKLEQAGDTSSDTYKAFTDKQRQIDVLLALKTSSSDPVLPSAEAAQIQPRLWRNTAAGVVGAIILGLILAIFVDSLYVKE
jgi:uncharacterized protein involved in exopolysaccharide biosynthesis